jgi:glycosidase
MTGAADPDNRRMMRFGNQLNEYEKQTLEDVSKLVHIRKNNSAIRYGDFLTLQADENIYAYLRSDMNERVLMIINKSLKEQSISFQLPAVYKIKKAIDLIDGKMIDINNNKLSADINKLKYLILKLE